MLNRSSGKQDKLIVTTLEQLMPEEHFLRDLERLVDFSFIYARWGTCIPRWGGNRSTLSC